MGVLQHQTLTDVGVPLKGVGGTPALERDMFSENVQLLEENGSENIYRYCLSTHIILSLNAPGRGLEIAADNQIFSVCLI